MKHIFVITLYFYALNSVKSLFKDLVALIEKELEKANVADKIA